MLASYAALFAPQVHEVIAVAPPASHMSDDAPQLLNVLRVCDIPDTFGMFAPCKLTIVTSDSAALERTTAAYRAAAAEAQLTITPRK